LSKKIKKINYNYLEIEFEKKEIEMEIIFELKKLKKK
jgi:hypothetical protein